MSTNLTSATSSTSTPPTSTTTTTTTSMVPASNSNSLFGKLQFVLSKIFVPEEATSEEATSLSFAHNDILYEVFSKLNRGSIYSLLSTNRRISEFILNGDSLWETLLGNHFSYCSLKQNVKAIELYKYRVNELMNITEGRFRKEIIKGNERISGFSGHSGKLALSSDKSIIIMDGENGNKKLEHINIITSEDLNDRDILFHKNMLFYRDNHVINVVDVNTGKQLYTINQNLRPRLTSNGLLFTSTDFDENREGYIKIFEIESGAEIIMIPCSNYRINDIGVNGDSLFVVLRNVTRDTGLIEQFDIVSGKKIGVFNVCRGFAVPNKIVVNDNKLYCLCISSCPVHSFIVILDIKAREVLKKINLTSPKLNKLFLFDKVFIACAADGTIEILDCETGESIKVIRVNDFRVNDYRCSVTMSDHKLLLRDRSGNNIKVIDFGFGLTQPKI